MSVLATKSPIKATILSLGGLYFFFATGLFLDSLYFANITNNAQLSAFVVMILVFTIIFFRVNKRIKEQMIVATLIAIIGEYLFSIALGMYTYRLENVPHYIPPGHALVYVAVLYFSKASSIIKLKKLLEIYFSIAIIIYATAFLIFRNDVFGFVMTAATLYILRKKPRERLFYLAMYISVAVLEIIGTSYQCWWWPETAWDVFYFLPSANPPSGISFFYFGLDLSCLWLYKQRHKIAWKRMKLIRKLKQEKQ
jgi:uncharacterized membrane protein YbaN (DUF454 family)